MSTERDDLEPLRVLDDHKPTHSEYTGGWWELACTGCDFAKGRRLSHLDWAPHHAHRAAIFHDALLAAGYRKVFDGDCGLGNVADPSDREAAEAWMRWANLAMNDEIGAIGAMKQMLTEFGYRKPRTITTTDELDALPAKSAILDNSGTPWVGDGDKVEPWASVCEDPYGGPIWKDSADIELPATVLYEPEAS